VTLRETVFARCTTHVGLSALIGMRCYPERLVENAVYPAVTFIAPVSRVDDTYRTHSNVNSPVTRAVSRVQFNCFDDTGDGAEDVADQVIQAWSGFKDGCDVGYAFIANKIATREDELKAFRFIVDVLIEHAV
jgi:hypothetical protein